MTQLTWFDNLMIISKTNEKSTIDFFFKLQHSIDLKYNHRLWYFDNLMDTLHY